MVEFPTLTEVLELFSPEIAVFRSKKGVSPPRSIELLPPIRMNPLAQLDLHSVSCIVQKHWFLV